MGVAEEGVAVVLLAVVLFDIAFEGGRWGKGGGLKRPLLLVGWVKKCTGRGLKISGVWFKECENRLLVCQVWSTAVEVEFEDFQNWKSKDLALKR